MAINLFRMIEAEMASHAASALGLGFLGMVLPLLGLSAPLLLPSTALFCFASMRQRFRVVRYWFLLWCVNLGLSALFLSVLALFLWAFLTVPKIPAS
ncbi:hypothetical protein [Paucibacter sp. KBW04]|uniref:hypothetical protein n=1 Tax=Paucibacter sp. KBW04 TaxID=2153361 RepID=UPI000F570308|nr:hypothetical protein [Paucibacter sp. KBW04]